MLLVHVKTIPGFTIYNRRASQLIRLLTTSNRSFRRMFPKRKLNSKLKYVRARKAWKHVEEYCGNSSIHGFSYFLKKDIHVFERIWWIIAVILSMIGCCLLITSSYQKWNENPIIVTFSEKMTSIKNIPFPAVTLCPSIKTRKNILDFSSTILKLRKKTSLDFINDSPPYGLSEEEFRLVSAQFLTCDDSILPNSHAIDEKKINNSVFDLIKMMAPNATDVFFDCKFRYGDYDCDTMFLETLTEEGLCFSFNTFSSDYMFINGDQGLITDRGRFAVYGHWAMDDGYDNNADTEINAFPYRLYEGGAKVGLLLILSLKEIDFDYVCRGPVQGFKVMLHNPYELPDLNSNFFRVPVDQDIRISIKPNVLTTSKSLHDYSPERRQCYFNTERQLRFMKTYSQRNCELECVANATFKYCGCVKFFMPRDEKTPICGIGMVDCCHKAEVDLWSNAGAEDPMIKYCNCLPACNSISYDAEVSHSKYEFLKYVEEFEENSSDVVGLKLSHLSVFFKETQFVTSKRSELIGMTDFVASCGGLLGLFMGISLLSIVELVYYFSLRVFCSLHSTNAPKHVEIGRKRCQFNTVQPKKSRSLEPRQRFNFVFQD